MQTEFIAKIAAYKAYCLGREGQAQGRSTELVELALRSVSRLKPQPSSAVVLRRWLFYALVLAELHRTSNPLPFRETAMQLGEKLENLGQHDSFDHYMKIVNATDRPYTTASFGDMTIGFPHERFRSTETDIDSFGNPHSVDLALLPLGLSEVELAPYTAFLEMSLRQIVERHGLTAK